MQFNTSGLTYLGQVPMLVAFTREATTTETKAHFHKAVSLQKVVFLIAKLALQLLINLEYTLFLAKALSSPATEDG